MYCGVPIMLPGLVSFVVASMIRAMPKSVTIARCPDREHVVWFQVTVHDPGSVRVRKRVRDLLADLRYPLPRHAPGRGDLGAQRPA